MPDKFKVLMILHGVWPIPVPENISPIELEPGISLVTIERDTPSVYETPDPLVFSIHEKGDLQMSTSLTDFPFKRLPRMGLLFEVQEKDSDGSTMYMPHKYANLSLRAKTILRLFQTGEPISSFIIHELGFETFTPISSDPQLLPYEISSNTIQPLKDFYSYLLPKWNSAEVLLQSNKSSKTVNSLYLRMNYAVQFLDKSYLDDFEFSRPMTLNTAESFRFNNYLRMIFAWMGIETLTCHSDAPKLAQLKRHLPIFLPGYSVDQFSHFVDKLYGMRSAYIHADPSDMAKILDKDMNAVRDVLKHLIMVYFLFAEDKDIYKELAKNKDINPIKGLVKMDLSKYHSEIRKNSGANFGSYNF